jgi:hypothetical protein
MSRFEENYKGTWLLEPKFDRACGERPCNGRAAEQRDELATFHLTEFHLVTC